MTFQDISREQLVGCWKKLDSHGYWELREDGTARHKLTGRGTHCDIDEITWDYVTPDGFRIEIARSSSETEDSHFDIWEYRVKYFNGKTLELWNVRFNEHVAENVLLTQPVCWKKSRPPKSWQTDLL